MDIDGLVYHILQDAVKEDLLPTALISRYDVTLDRLMHCIRSLLSEGFIELTARKWIRITEKGKHAVKEKDDEKVREIGEWKSNYVKEFFCRENIVEVNEPFLPSTEGLKNIMEGAGLKETSNEK